jgi:formate hydrogenlyase subunit 6/NADH:ubiquinone oxidoreductase subunit I
MVPQLLGQLFKKPFTNKFPAKYIPSSTTKFLEKVKEGKAKIIPPVDPPEGFRGKIQYDKDTCIGCKLCIRVCPSGTIEFKPDEKKVRFFISRCTFCSQCVEVCPVNCISMSNEFLLADSDKQSQNLIVE